MNFWRSLVGKLWITIICLVGSVLIFLGLFLLPYINRNFAAHESTEIKHLFTYTCIVGFLLTTFFALFLFTKITQPMQLLIQAANAIREGRYDTRLSLVTSDEIGELAKTFNHMSTELEATIRSLNEEKNHLSSVLRSMSDAVFTFDRSGQIILTNPPAQSLLDIWEKLEWQGRDLEEFGASVPEPLLPLFHTVMDRGEDVGDYIHVKKGSWSVQMAPLYTDNAIRGAVAVLRDITEEVKLEKMRSDFVANVSHEIRTPLSMMQGYSEALLDGMAGSPEESEELVQVIHDESLRMGRLVKDLLDLARMEAGHTDMYRQEVDVNELIERVHRKFTVRSKERGLILDYYESDQHLLLPEADEDRLEQVLTNLLDNAFRHTPSGKKVTIAADQIRGERNELIRIRIKDEGVGIASEDLPYIFDRFYKADKARVRGEDKGTGLGLAIVRNIVEAHGGSVSASSVLGEGTEFTILLPISNKTRQGSVTSL
ncbi:sensor histidine kinase [Paenibacillus polymyxa]|uniref:sensor histidine kinase n=1 Tax=Paenibacillus polymyxa TaxID=1406 RepID=UPI0010BE9799|nr:ATP-binding protein [Paenibacillus polymyxa]TKH36157.1 sensor histidine kinase [Paenibacillus polymyxa]